MKKLLTAIGLSVSLGAGAFALDTVLPASAEPPASAADPAGHPRLHALDGVLDGLVADGTLTDAQAQAVRDGVKEVRSDLGGRPGMKVLKGAVDAAAEAIGVDPADLKAALKDGRSVADVAADHGVDRQAVVDALVAKGNTALDAAVADGTIEAGRAGKVRDRLPDLADRLVDAHRTGG
jgi:polyhydroxyalkanoate synthesis regulator phasin